MEGWRMIDNLWGDDSLDRRPHLGHHLVLLGESESLLLCNRSVLSTESKEPGKERDNLDLCNSIFVFDLE